MAEKVFFKVTLKRGKAGRPEKQRKVLAGLGLTKVGRTVCLDDTPEVRGMLYKVVHLVEVAKCSGEKPQGARARRRAADAA